MPDKPYTFIENKKPRAPRAKVIEAQIWKQFKEILQHLYYEQNLSVQDVKDYMLRHHHFKATARQYGRQFHDKWHWPKKRSEAADITRNDASGTDQQALPTVPESRFQIPPLQIETSLQPLIWESTVDFEVEDRQIDTTVTNLQRDRFPDDSPDSDVAELCSLETSSTSPSARSFSRSAPATPDLSESLPVPFFRSRVNLKTPSRNAFRPETPELYVLKEHEYEDIEEIFHLFPSPPGTPQLSVQTQKSKNRASAVIGNLLTISPTERLVLIEEDFVPPPFIVDHDTDEKTPIHVSQAGTSCFEAEVNGIGEQDCPPDPRGDFSELGLQTAMSDGRSQYIQDLVPANEDSQLTLFRHQHDKDHPPVEACCWPEVAQTALARCASNDVLMTTLDSITSDDRHFSAAILPSGLTRAKSMLNQVEKTVCRIDAPAVQIGDIAKVIRFTDFLSAARFFDDSFLWSRIIWDVLDRRDDVPLASSSVYHTKVPVWLSVFTNMAKSSSEPEHLQLLAAAIQDVPILETFTKDISHRSALSLYAHLGDALQRLSDPRTANDAALGCWTSILTSKLQLPNALTKQVVLPGIKKARDGAHTISTESQRQADSILQFIETGLEQEVIAITLERCVRTILAWCKEELQARAFTEMGEGISEIFWGPSIDPLDIARFERLAVFSYLCKRLWSQEHLDDQIFWADGVDVVNALQTMMEYTGLTNEATLGAVLGMARPVLRPSTNPERSTMAHRFSHSVERLYNDTVMKASGFGNVGRTMNIDDVMDRYCWAGNSTPSLLEFQDPDYAKEVGIFVREEASRSLDISSSQAFQPILGDLHEGELFCQDMLMQSPRSSQMSADRRSMWSLNARIRASRKTPRNSSNSSKYKCYGSEDAAVGFDPDGSTRYCPLAYNNSNISLAIHRLSEQLQLRMSLDGEQNKHVSATSSQMVWSSIEEENEVR